MKQINVVTKCNCVYYAPNLANIKEPSLMRRHFKWVLDCYLAKWEYVLNPYGKPYIVWFMTRIKYKKKGNYLISSYMLIGYDLYYVKINTTRNKYYLVNSKREILEKGKAKSLDKLKRLVKNRLIEHGVVFCGEIRVGKKLEKLKWNNF